MPEINSRPKPQIFGLFPRASNSKARFYAVAVYRFGSVEGYCFSLSRKTGKRTYRGFCILKKGEIVHAYRMVDRFYARKEKANEL